MKPDPDPGPPYFESPLDRWKLAVLLILFLVLLLTAMAWPDSAAIALL